MIDIYNPNVANSLVALRDLAEAGARVLNEREAHYFAQYPLCSTSPVSDAECIRVIGEHIGKKIEVLTPILKTVLASFSSFYIPGTRRAACIVGIMWIRI